MTLPQKKPKSAKPVIRLNHLPRFLGNKETQNAELVRLGLLHPFSLSPGGRSKVVYEDEVIELQEAAEKAGSLEALIANAKQQAFGRQLLKLIAETGNDGMEMQELVVATGRSAEDIEDMLQRLRDAGYTRQRSDPDTDAENCGRVLEQSMRKQMNKQCEDLDADELRVLNYVYSRSSGEDDPGLQGLRKEDVPAEEAGWTPDQDDGGNLTKQILRALFLKGLIQDTGWRRRGEISGRYEISWAVTDLAVELYGEQMRQNQELLRQKILELVRELDAVRDRPPDDATKAKFRELNQLARQLERGPQIEQPLRQMADSLGPGLGQEWLDQINQICREEALQSWHPNNSRSN
jgi:hypothetical protein